jgi:hypothetical protein
VIETEYANTDFDLKSQFPFDVLHDELAATCRVLHYTHGDYGNWHAIVEARHGEDSRKRDAEKDIWQCWKRLRNSPQRRGRNLRRVICGS